MQLKQGTLLQGGKYEIERVLGQGGFGITYQASQVLYGKRVCIKEFFFKDYCIRNTVGDVTSVTEGNRDIVDKFLNKFLKEAKIISSLNHPNIVRILDVFEENNTAYYVMEYVNGYSLADRVNKYGALNENDAVGYIKQVAGALDYIHQQRINHLDVKPANIMIRRSDNKAILIDFGVSKQYDVFGGQTSTTPVGISHGYAPMEQYNAGGVSSFSPQTDIYSLGATLYKLVTGKTPPQAGEILNDGLPELPSTVSENVAETIKKSMQARKLDRYNNIDEFLIGLDVETHLQQETKCQHNNVWNEETHMFGETEIKGKTSQSQNSDERSSYMTSTESEKNDGKKKYGCILFFVLAWFLIIVYFSLRGNGGDKSNNPNDTNKVTQQSAGTYKQQSTSQKQVLTPKDSYGICNVEKVDLGLSVQWAGWNVGTRSAEGYGGLYQPSNVPMNGWTGWRLPTEAELDELRNSCKWSWINYKGVYGMKVVGPNGNAIFLPASGLREEDNTIVHRNLYGGYWSCDVSASATGGGYYLSFDDFDGKTDEDGYPLMEYGYYRYLDKSVRLVHN